MTEKNKKLQLLLNKQILKDEVKNIFDKSIPKPLYITIFKQAEMYNRAYQVLESKMNEANDLSLVSPMLMNICFSIELLMKSFIVFERKNVFEFEQLSNNSKEIYGHKY